jgi:hypothetical protein
MRDDNYVYVNSDKTVTLDGDFTIEELQEIIRRMRE